MAVSAYRSGTLNPVFVEFGSCAVSVLFFGENADIFPHGKIWWNKNLKAFLAPKKAKDHPDRCLCLSQRDFEPRFRRDWFLRCVCSILRRKR
jgi:hypothetical protein